MPKYTRRQLLRLGALGAGAAGLPLGLSGCRPSAREAPSADSPDFSVAFLTDMHVHGEQGSADGFSRALRHAVDRPDKPAFVLSGGDQPFDILATDVAAADAQYDLWDAAVSGVDVDIHPTLGNHDVLGIYDESPVEESDPLYGKAYFLRRFALERPYYSFDWEGWHFVVLDSIGIDGNTYRGWVDAEQIAWLSDDLAAAAKPTVITTHVPLLTNYLEMRRGTAEPIPPGVAIVNAHEVIAAIAEHPVKLVLGGHLHINESFRFKGTEYATIGAVSGNWWQGPRDGFEEGYARLDFRGDEVRWTYVDYGWDAVPDEATG